MIKAKSYPVLLETEVCTSSSISPDCVLSKSIFKGVITCGLKAQLRWGKIARRLYSKSSSELHKDIFWSVFIFDKALVCFVFL